MANASSLRFLLLTLTFHLLYISSVFDIYFTSPVVHPILRFTINDTFEHGIGNHHQFQAPANRLVLLVADGLRADTLFKAHNLQMIPVWARQDLESRSTGDLQDTGASNWPEFERTPLHHDHPYKLALQETRPATEGIKSANMEKAFAGPFLRSVAKHRGVWGLSHTRVPTESRPGHVAMIAGMYEDVSAVTKGWRLNPIAFDSVLNQSSHSFAFGSPDIVPMFAVGAASDRVDMWTYDEEAEDFTKDATSLDLWVLDRLRELFQRAKLDAELSKKMRQKGTVFFLHLLGLDTTGHTFRPFSQEYVGNTIVVDALAKEVEKLFDDFYDQDAKTAYVFTADHGMSTKGNHGDGDPDNTRTPIVAWGAGVRRPLPANHQEMAAREEQQQKDRYYQEWHLDQVSRVDIDQADVTPLMASLIGIPIPANSEGKLRTEILDISPEHKARALMANAMQVLETYRVKHDDRDRRMIHFVPFKPLVGSLPGSEQLANIRRLLEQQDWQAASSASEELIDLSLQGAQYLQMYDWLMLCSIVTMGYLGSILYGLAFLFRAYVVPPAKLAQLPQPGRLTGLGKAVAAPVLGAIFTKFAKEESPITYYLYTTMAAFLWGRVIDERHLLAESLRTWRQGQDASMFSFGLHCLLGLVALELMVVGYLHRVAWFIGFLIIGFAWPAFLNADFKSENEALLLAWGLSCLCSGLFTIANVDKQESIPILVLSGVVFLLVGLVVTRKPEWFFPGNQPFLRYTLLTLRIQQVVLAVTTIVTASSARSLQLKKGLPLPNQIIAWSALLFCFTFPFIYGFRRSGQPRNQRLAIVVFAFAPVFIMLSLRDEALFFGCYTLTLLVWAKVEGALHEQRKTSLDFRISIFFLFLLHVGFFGTGNVASISSFYLSPVYRLVPIFSPFLMASLLLVKILVPFLILNAIFASLCASPPSNKPTSSSNSLHLVGINSAGGLGLKGGALAPVFVACILTDVLALNFLYTVKSQGSWLEIGQTITHFVMANLLLVFMLALAAVSELVMGSQ